MSRVRFRRSLLLLASLVFVVNSVPSMAPHLLPRVVTNFLEPPAAQAQLADGGNFGSDVPCLEAPDQFVTSCFANTLVDDSASNGNSTSPVASSDTALVRFNTSGKTPLANLGQLGSIYGMAYDDGTVTGVRRLFVGAFARRMTEFGPSGPGGIYEYNLTTGALRTFTTVPGTTNRHGPGNDYSDAQVAEWVTKSSLGDLEMGPSGRYLYVMNLDTRQIDRYDILTGAQLTPLSLNLSAISSNPAVQADLRPFGLEFQPTTAAQSTSMLMVGFVDSAERSPTTVAPTAYVLAINTLTGAQTTILTQPLNDAGIANRFADGANAGATGWHGWTDTGQYALWAMPIVSDIQFSRDGQTMLLGFRDRNGDVYQSDRDDAWWRVQEQGDILVYKLLNGNWQLQTRSVSTPSDFFLDNYVGSSASTAHVENFMGAMALTLAGVSSSPTEQIVGTTITPFQGGTSGAGWYNVKPDLPDRRAAVELVPSGDLWKSATLGDLENLCTIAYIGDRVWSDADGNGLQDTGEQGMSGVLVHLLDAAGNVVAQATTDASGLYQFAVKPNLAYSIEIASSNFGGGKPLFDKIISPQNRGGDDAADSDADQLSRRIAVPAQSRDGYNMAFDVGIMTKSFANGEVGDLVWNDLNSNGIQDGGEPGISSITVRLIRTFDNGVSQTTVTSNSGLYNFIAIEPGTYIIEFVPPAGISATARDAGGDDARDSDADVSTGWRTPPFTVIADVTNYTLDLGLIMGANVRVVKSGPTSAPVGSRISYTIQYVNDGPAQAENIVVRDVFGAGLNFVSANPAPSSLSGSMLAWNIGALPPGGQGTIGVVFDIAANAPPTGANQATISTTTTNNNPGDDSSTVTTQFLRPNVWAQKSGTAVATVGDQLSYTIAYGNNGSANAAGVTLVDTLPNGLSFVSANPAPSSLNGQQVTWNLGTLAPSQQGNVTIVAQSSASLPNGTIVANQAQISTTSSGDTLSDNAASVSTVLQQADVRVAKSSSTVFPVVSGQQVTYTIDFANAGPAPAVNVTLNDNVPSQLTNVSWSCGSGCAGSGGGNTIALNLGTLAAGATGRITVTGTAQTATTREDFTNTATITTTTPETDTSNNQSSAPGAVWTADVQVLKLAQAQVAAGETFTATLAFKNNGPAPAVDLSLVDSLPAGVALVQSVPAPSSMNGQQVVWNLSSLADGQTGVIDLVLRSDAGIANDTSVVNHAQLDTTTSDRDPQNNRADASTLVVTRADLSVVKTAPVRADAGDTLLYRLSYVNNGPSVSRNAVLTDSLPVELDYLSASSAPARIAGGVASWTLGDLQPGERGVITVQMRSRAEQTVAALAVTNTLQIGSSTEDPVPENNLSTVATSLETADISVVKHSPPYVVAGLPFTITLEYTNAGPAVAKAVTLRDILPSGLTVVSSNPPATGPGLRWNLGDLAGGASGSVSVVLRAPTTAISGTTYTNVAVIDTPASPERDPSNDTSSTVSTLRPYADLAIVKSGPTNPIRSGSVVSYMLSYRNNGPSQALDVQVEDVLPVGFTLASAVPLPTTNVNGVLSWNIGALNTNASGAITVTGTLAGDGVTTTRTNVAAISSPTTPDPTPGNNASTVTTLVQNPDLRISKTDNLTHVRPGDTLTYEVVVENTGAAAASSVLLRETPPEDAAVLSPEWTAQSDGTYTLLVGDLAAGQQVMKQFVLRLPNPLPIGMANIENMVFVGDDGSAGADPTPGDNTGIDSDLPVVGRVGDTVWYDKDGDGQQDTGEAGLGDVVVQLLDPDTNAILAAATTDTSGHYSFGGLRTGTYAVGLAPEATRSGPLRGFRYTTAVTPIGAISDTNAENLSLDIGLNNPGTTDVVLAYLRAERSSGGLVEIKWRTLEEVNTSRFRVLRDLSGNTAEVAVVPSKGSTGGTYVVRDVNAPIRARYWLIEIERSGKETSYGPFSQQAPAATGTTTGLRTLYLPFIGS